MVVFWFLSFFLYFFWFVCFCKDLCVLLVLFWLENGEIGVFMGVLDSGFVSCSWLCMYGFSGYFVVRSSFGYIFEF